MQITIWLSFLAGLASFFSPCIFPVVPAYLSYLGAKTIPNDNSKESTNKNKLILNALFFILGFTFTFIFLAFLVVLVGNLFNQIRYFLEKIGGVIIIVFGLQLAGVIHIPFLEKDGRLVNRINENKNLATSFLFGLLFSVGWSPCIGPVLGAIYTIVWIDGSYFNGAIQLLFFSAGLAVPFILLSLGIKTFFEWIKRHQKLLRITQLIMALMMVILGFLLFFGVFQRLALYGNIFNL